MTALIGIGTLAGGVWCLAAPDSFARAVAFEPHEHFLRWCCDCGNSGTGCTVHVEPTRLPVSPTPPEPATRASDVEAQRA